MFKLFKKCKHERVLCIHGDEIWTTGKGFFNIQLARARCADCRRPLYDVDLPEVCTNTNIPHYTPKVTK